MDSMGGLHTSLPGNSPNKNQTQTHDPPEQLLHAFKAAALSVTQLYKTAATDQSRARSEGYQEALDELLAFLDKENIGLDDGEGWRIRQWATERLDGRETTFQTTESDEDISEKVDRDVTPVIHRSQSAQNSTTSTSTRTASPVRAESVPPTLGSVNPPIASTSNFTIPQSTFTFRSSQTYPQETDMTLSSLDLSDSRPQSESTPSVNCVSHAPNSSSGVTVARPLRTSLRHSHPSNRHNRVPTTIGKGAGQKRKINYADFFDFGNLNHGKDGFGGNGKRTRFV